MPADAELQPDANQAIQVLTVDNHMIIKDSIFSNPKLKSKQIKKVTNKKSNISNPKLKSTQIRPKVTFDENVTVQIIPKFRSYSDNTNGNSDYQKKCKFTQKLCTAESGLSYSSKKLTSARRAAMVRKKLHQVPLTKKETAKRTAALFFIPIICVIVLL